MKKFSLLIIIFICFSLLIGKSSNSDYIIIAWNDLGMHCSNKDFSTMVILPPHNNIYAQVIKKGDALIMPDVVTTGVNVTYEIPGNTYSVGKTNFWDYAKTLFDVTLAPNIGLTGNGLNGKMKSTDNYFSVTGVPITPYTDIDLKNEDPYQQALIKLFDSDSNLLATANPVVPVSNEISCVSSGCHSSEQSILNSHPKENGFNPSIKPIFCAKCHPSNAVKVTMTMTERTLSYRIHQRHRNLTSDCYKCHPGPKTQCYRDIMFDAGKKCTDCHGTMSQIASTVNSGRRPWLDEPSCSNTGCHTSHFSPEKGKLYRESKGHGGLFCSACHGSPHAIYPTINERDNQLNIDLQGFSGKLKDCKVCHGIVPSSPGPHGYLPADVKFENDFVSESNVLLANYPNPVVDQTTLKFRLAKSGFVKIEIFDINGNKVAMLVNEYLQPGEYSVPAGFRFLNNGVYNCYLVVGNQSYSQIKMIVSR